MDKSICLPDGGNTLTMLLYKKGDRNLLSNWRPIALTNTDSRIFSKILAARIGSFAERIISPNQFGFVINRKIWDNIHLVNNVIEANPKKGALIFLDQEKAYDRVDWRFLNICLKKANFPDKFLNWLNNYLGAINYKIRSSNGFTNKILPTRGLRQGDPLSPILYNFFFDPFLRTINKKLIGISIRGQRTLTSLAFADDCVLLVNDSNDVKKFVSVYTTFSKVSQAKINESKTEVIKLGSERLKLPWNAKPSNKPIRHLGVLLSNNGFESKLMEGNMISKIQSKISTWQPRFISIIGRIRLINIFIVSQVNYLAQGIPISNNFIKNFNSLTQKFIWNTSYPPAPISLCYGSNQSGGLGLINMAIHTSKLYMKTLANMIDPGNEESNWYRPRNIFLARALRLKLPTIRTQLANYFAAHPLGSGPHHLSERFKPTFQLIKRSKTKILLSRATGL